MRTYYFDVHDGVPIRDITGLQFRTNSGAIEHSKELARRFSHDHRLMRKRAVQYRDLGRVGDAGLFPNSQT